MIKSLVQAFWQEEEGQDMVEYGLLLAFIAIVAVAALSAIKTNLSTIWQSVNSSVATAAGS